jgi:hypothetical protein
MQSLACEGWQDLMSPVNVLHSVKPYCLLSTTYHTTPLHFLAPACLPVCVQRLVEYDEGTHRLLGSLCSALCANPKQTLATISAHTVPEMPGCLDPHGELMRAWSEWGSRRAGKRMYDQSHIA